MKKRTILFLVIIAAIGYIGIKIFIESNRVYDYYITNNANDLYAQHLGIGTPESNKAIPFDIDITILKEIDPIEEVLPYYSMYIGMEQEKTELLFISDKQNHSITLPFVKEEENIRWKEFFIGSYADDQIFKSKLKLKHTYHSDSGIYITEEILDRFNVSIGGNKLVLKTEVFIPKTAYRHEAEKCHRPDGPDSPEICKKFEAYDELRYVSVPVELEIEGVISENDQLFGSSREIFIPYELSTDIYQQSQSIPFELEENEETWRPITFILKLNERMDTEKLGELVHQYIDKFMMYKHDYTDASEWDHRIIY